MSVMTSWELEGASMNVWAATQHWVGLTKPLPWQVEEGKPGLITQLTMATCPEPVWPPPSSERVESALPGNK